MISNRFQIEEMVSQACTGAVFLATDSQTGSEVIIQRFFPFEDDKRGLHVEELEAYKQGIQQMKQWKFSTFRHVVDGGSDPVDGIPYLVTDLMSGISLREHCGKMVMNTSQARLMVETALALLNCFETAFGREADWVSLHIDDIEVMADGEQFRFGVDPMKWLGRRSGPGAIKELAALVEEIMGWKGRVLVAGKTDTVGAWLNAAKTRDLSLVEAWEILQGGSPNKKIPISQAALAPSFAAPAPLSQQVPLASAKSGGNAAWIIIGALFLVGGLAVAVVALNSHNNQPVAAVPEISAQQTHVTPAIPAAPVTPVTPAIPVAIVKPSAVIPQPVAEKKLPETSSEEKKLADIERRARELQAGTVSAVTEQAKTPAVPKKESYMPGEIELIREQKGESISIVGRVSKVKLSTTGNSVYVEFDGGAPTRACGRYFSNLSVEGMSASELGYLEGKTVRMTGVVQIEFGTKRTVLDLKSPSQIVEQSP